jgi:MFS family permease
MRLSQRAARSSEPVHGLAANLPQLALLVAVNALVGGMLGQERTVVPLLGEQVFQLGAHSAALTFILAFGISKAITNYYAGTWSDRVGRKPVLVTGWLVAVPIPFLLIWAPNWGWVVFANVLLGVSQGLTWSMTVVMKIDIVGPDRRGMAMGLNQAAGYTAVAGTALATGYIAESSGLRPEPFFLGIAFAALGLGLSLLAVKETHAHVHAEAAARTEAEGPSAGSQLTDREVFLHTSFKEPALSAISQAGFAKNLNDGMAWGLFPLLFAASGLSVSQIGILVAAYPALWGLGQLVTGGLSDRWGRKQLIVVGMLTQAAGLAGVAVADSFTPWLFAALVLGAGSALAYPTLLAAVGDVAHPTWRARALGVYRLWRDGGFAAGAVLSGVVADLWGLRPAIAVVAGITAVSGLIVLVRMYETRPRVPA